MTPAIADATLPHTTRIALDAESRAGVVTRLNARLADAIDLQRQAKQAHWNVKGPHFMPLHELFDAVASLAVTWSDDIAERLVQLGGVAEGDSRTVADRSSLPTAPDADADATTWTRAVADALGAFANTVRDGIHAADEAGDAVTADLLTQIGGAADKQLWFVEAHLHGR